MYERAIRLVCNDYINSCNNLLKKTRKKNAICNTQDKPSRIVYKVLHEMSPPVDNSFPEQVSPYNMRDNLKLMKPVYNTVQYGMKSIAYQGPLVWNMLPHNLKNLENFLQFKDLLGRRISLVPVNVATVFSVKEIPCISPCFVIFSVGEKLSACVVLFYFPIDLK